MLNCPWCRNVRCRNVLVSNRPRTVEVKLSRTSEERRRRYQTRHGKSFVLLEACCFGTGCSPWGSATSLCLCSTRSMTKRRTKEGKVSTIKSITLPWHVTKGSYNLCRRRKRERDESHFKRGENKHESSSREKKELLKRGERKK